MLKLEKHKTKKYMIFESGKHVKNEHKADAVIIYITISFLSKKQEI